MATLEGHSRSVNCVKYLENDQLISGSADKKIKVWDLRTNLCVNTIKGHKKPVSCLEVISSTRFASASADGVVKVWDLESGECLHTLEYEESEVIEITENDEHHTDTSLTDYRMFIIFF